MSIETAQSFLGRKCVVRFTDSYGDNVVLNLKIRKVTSTPLYGSFLIGDIYDVNLEMVMCIHSS